MARMNGIERQVAVRYAGLSGLVGLVISAAACAAEPRREADSPKAAREPYAQNVSSRAALPSPVEANQNRAIQLVTLNATGRAEALAWPFGPGPSEGELSAQVERLLKDPGPIRSNWTPPGKSVRYGHAEGLIDAAYDVVRARLLDFVHYKELAGPKFNKVSVVDKTAAGTDVYFSLPIMRGIVTLWYVTRFKSARPAANGAEVVEGQFVKGNIKDMQIVFTVRRGPESKTLIVCDLNLAISLPAPQELLDEELRDACGDAVVALRASSLRVPVFQ